MRIAQVNGRAVLLTQDDAGIDIADASGGRFPARIQELLLTWSQLRDWAAQVEPDTALVRFTPQDLQCPVSEARQVFAIGLNYADHVGESKVRIPAEPAVFTKFPTSLGAPFAEVALPEGDVDWEAELVVVIGEGGRDISEQQAWDHVAAVAVGQDLSERRLQKVGDLPQFSLAKSHADFSPVGPYLVSVDELSDPDDLAIGCSLNGEQMQKSRTAHLIFPVPTLIAKLSAVVELLPGDLIFTGTPSGVGLARSPQRFIGPGDELVTTIEGVGAIRQTFTASTRKEN